MIRRRPGAVRHLPRHAVVGNERRVATKTAGVTLHHEAPERLAGIGNEPGPLAITSPRGGFLRTRRVVGPQHRERGFQAPPLAAERRGLFLPNLELNPVGRFLECQNGTALPVLPMI